MFPHSLSPAGFGLYFASPPPNRAREKSLFPGCIFFRLNRPNSLQFVCRAQKRKTTDVSVTDTNSPVTVTTLQNNSDLAGLSKSRSESEAALDFLGVLCFD